MNATFCGPADILFLVFLVFTLIFFFVTTVQWGSTVSTKDFKKAIASSVIFVFFATGAVFFGHASHSDWNYNAAVRKEAERQLRKERLERYVPQRKFEEDVAAKKAEILQEEESQGLPDDQPEPPTKKRLTYFQ